MPSRKCLARSIPWVLIALLAAAPESASAQFVDDSRERYGFDTPEGWAMAWVTSSTLLTAFGATLALARPGVSP